MKIKVPKQFEIGSTQAYVGFMRHLHSDEGFNGTYNRRTGKLEVDAHLWGAKRDRTFAHEVNEVIKENYDLGISESDMTCIANGWIEFLGQLGIELDWSLIEACK